MSSYFVHNEHLVLVVLLIDVQDGTWYLMMHHRSDSYEHEPCRVPGMMLMLMLGKSVCSAASD